MFGLPQGTFRVNAILLIHKWFAIFQSERQEAPASLPPQPSRKELAEIKKHNLGVRSEAYRAVRRPGKGET